MARQLLGGLGHFIEASRPHSVGLLWARGQLVAETSTWQHSQKTDIHALSGIQTHDPSKRAAQTHALDRVATGIGSNQFIINIFIGYIEVS